MNAELFENLLKAKKSDLENSVDSVGFKCVFGDFEMSFYGYEDEDFELNTENVGRNMPNGRFLNLENSLTTQQLEKLQSILYTEADKEFKISEDKKNADVAFVNSYSIEDYYPNPY